MDEDCVKPFLFIIYYLFKYLSFSITGGDEAQKAKRTRQKQKRKITIKIRAA